MTNLLRADIYRLVRARGYWIMQFFLLVFYSIVSTINMTSLTGLSLSDK